MEPTRIQTHIYRRLKCQCLLHFRVVFDEAFGWVAGPYGQRPIVLRSEYVVRQLRLGNALGFVALVALAAFAVERLIVRDVETAHV